MGFEHLEFVAHLSCKAVTVNACFCRKCGKPLNERNTRPVLDENLHPNAIDALKNDACYVDYDNLETVCPKD